MSGLLRRERLAAKGPSAKASGPFVLYRTVYTAVTRHFTIVDMFNVLFLCTGNSARSILAESLINDPRVGKGKFTGYSAGSHPKGEVHPLALATLSDAGFNADGFRSKSWEEFSGPDAPALDFVFTVCDSAASEVCPIWPGQPMTAHWGIPDPAAVEGSEAEKRRAFREAFLVLRRRIDLFACLPLDKLDRLAIQKDITDIGQR